MKKSLVILVAATVCFGCNNTTTTTTTTTTIDTAVVVHTQDHTHEMFQLDSALMHYATSPQHLKSSVVSPSKAVGVNGTVISVVPADLEMVSGKPLANHIDIELKEITTSEELAREGISTFCNDKFQVSGGAYYINMTSGGEQLRLKPGKTLAVRFKRIAERDMSLFLGIVDSTGKMTWRDGRQPMDTVELIPNPADEGNKLKKHTSVGDLYDYTLLSQFGWINLAGDIDNEMTSLTADVEKTDSVNYIAAYLVFKDLGSVMKADFDLSRQQCSFSNIPLGAKAALIVMGMKGGKMYTSKSKIVTTNARKVPVKLNATSDSEVVTLFKLN